MWKTWSFALGLLLGAIYWFTGNLPIGFLALAAILVFAPALVLVVGLVTSFLIWMKFL